MSLVVLGLFAGGCSAGQLGGGGKGGSDSTSGWGTGGAGADTGLGFGGSLGGAGPSAGVPETCEAALANKSYIGCNYWPTVTSNSGVYSGFEFAIAVANPTQSQATVTVVRGAAQVAQVTIEPGQLETIKLPWVDELKQQNDPLSGISPESALVVDGAYEVTSTVPVTVYQFNPLDFQLSPAPANCPSQGLDGGCYSFSNDASMMLPTSALRTEYYVMSYPTFHLGQMVGFGDYVWQNNPGFVAVTATADGTTVTVESSSHVRAGAGVSPLVPGGQATYNLNRGDVVMLSSAAMPDTESPQPGVPCELESYGTVIKCPSPPEYDLTGTHITANQPVSVVAGHDCTFVPFNRYACDHIEESMFPVETLGNDFIVSAPRSVASLTASVAAADYMFVRVLSAAADNHMTFDPPVHADLTLQAGEWIEIGPVTQDFRVLADDRVLVGQFMVGENFSGESAGAGDPAQSIAIPTDQYRLDYSFLAPVSYTYNLVNVVAPTGSAITLDGEALAASEFVAIGMSGMSVARHLITGGTHSISGDANFGIVVYGYGSYTSYMYPGGLNFETLIIGPN